MKRHGNLYEAICDPENIFKAYRRARQGKGWQRVIQSFEANLVGNLAGIEADLRSHTYAPAPYRIKKVYEPKERDIYVVPFRDRVVQHAIMAVVSPIWDGLLISDSYACRVGKGIHAGSRRTMQCVKRNQYVLKCDISKFYPSMNHETLFEIISHKIKCPPTLGVLKTIIDSAPGETNVPIGNYTSQWFGNLYMNEVDQRAKQVYHIKDYIRYCDDFLFFSNDKQDLRAIGDELPGWLRENLQLKLSKCDLFPVSHGVDFLGYRHFRTHILIRKSTVKRVKKRMKLTSRQFAAGQLSKDCYRSSLASTMGWLRWANSYNLRRSLGIDLALEAIR